MYEFCEVTDAISYASRRVLCKTVLGHLLAPMDTGVLTPRISTKETESSLRDCEAHEMELSSGLSGINVS